MSVVELQSNNDPSVLRAAGCLSIIVSQGSLDRVYPALILASTAAAMDKKVELFFTFYGLTCLLKNTRHLKVSPLGNPAMKFNLPFGPSWSGYTISYLDDVIK